MNLHKKYAAYKDKLNASFSKIEEDRTSLSEEEQNAFDALCFDLKSENFDIDEFKRNVENVFNPKAHSPRIKFSFKSQTDKAEWSGCKETIESNLNDLPAGDSKNFNILKSLISDDNRSFTEENVSHFEEAAEAFCKDPTQYNQSSDLFKAMKKFRGICSGILSKRSKIAGSSADFIKSLKNFQFLCYDIYNGEKQIREEQARLVREREKREREKNEEQKRAAQERARKKKEYEERQKRIREEMLKELRAKEARREARLRILKYLLLIVAGVFAVSAACFGVYKLISAVFFSGEAYESFLDVRDGSRYKTVHIGNATWFAENLHYRCDDSENGKNCYYNWPTAKNFCPIGTHLATVQDWQILFAAVGENGNAAKILKSESDWLDDGSGDNSLGFSIYPGGFHSYISDSTNGVGKFARFWTSDAVSSTMALRFSLSGTDSIFSMDPIHKNYELSVRCVVDFPVKEEEDAGNPAKTFLHPFRAIVVGNKTWSAENLNIPVENSYCYDDDDENCDKFGRLYTWSEAIKICPDGWFLPSNEEWSLLAKNEGGENQAGKLLKTASGWNGNGGGQDSFGFDALPAGSRLVNHGDFVNQGDFAYFWSATESGQDDAYNYYLESNTPILNQDINNKYFAYSVRCVEGSPKYAKQNGDQQSEKQISSSSSETENLQNRAVDLLIAMEKTDTDGGCISDIQLSGISQKLWNDGSVYVAALAELEKRNKVIACINNDYSGYEVREKVKEETPAETQPVISKVQKLHEAKENPEPQTFLNQRESALLNAMRGISANGCVSEMRLAEISQSLWDDATEWDFVVTSLISKGMIRNCANGGYMIKEKK